MKKQIKPFLILGTVLISCDVTFAYEKVTFKVNQSNKHDENKAMVIDIYESGKEVESPVKEYVEEYILNTRGWNIKDYALKSNTKNDESMLEVYVYFKADFKNAIPGGGQSFLLYINVKEMKVMRELAFQ